MKKLRDLLQKEGQKLGSNSDPLDIMHEDNVLETLSEESEEKDIYKERGRKFFEQIDKKFTHTDNSDKKEKKEKEKKKERRTYSDYSKKKRREREAAKDKRLAKEKNKHKENKKQ